MAEQYCFLGWLHHILWSFILPTLKQQGTAEVHCFCTLLKPCSALPEAVPLPRKKQRQSLGPCTGTCSVQHCIYAISIILEWREKQNVQLRLCCLIFFILFYGSLFFFLKKKREFMIWKRCQMEGSGVCSPQCSHGSASCRTPCHTLQCCLAG